MADRTEEQALLAWKQQMQAEREAAAKAVEGAEKSGKKSEADFAKGLPAGVAAGLAKGWAFLGDLLLIDAKGEKRTQLEATVDSYVSSFKEGKSPSFQSGMDAGETLTMFGGPEDLVRATPLAVAIKQFKKKHLPAASRGISIVDDLIAQIADLKSNGEPIPYEISEMADALGIDVAKVIPARRGEKNVGSFRASSQASELSGDVYKIDPETGSYVDDAGEEFAGSARERQALEAGSDRNEQSMLAYTQTEGNPLEDVGSEPQGFPPAGKVLEQHGIFASRLSKVTINGKRRRVWVGDKLDPEAADAFLKVKLREKINTAAKSEKGAARQMPPRYIVYDADNKVAYEVTTKNGEVVVQKNNQFKPLRVDSDTDNVRAGFTEVRVSSDPKEGMADAVRLDKLRGKRLYKNPEDFGPDEVIYGSDPKTGLPVKEYLEKRVSALKYEEAMKLLDTK